MRNLRVCILSTSYPRFKNDFYATFIQQLLERLLKKDLYVDVVCSHSYGIPINEVNNGIKIHRYVYMLPFKLQNLTYTGGMPNKLKSSFFAKLEIIPFLISFFIVSLKVSKNCDVIHAHWIISGMVAILVKKIYKRPVVLTIHAGDYIDFAAKTKLLKKISSYIFMRVDKIVSVSENIKKNICKFGISEDKIVVIPNGVDTNIFSLTTIAECRFRLLWVGRMGQEKGLEYLIQAIKYVSLKIPEVRLTLVGEGQVRKKLKNMSDRLGLKNNIIFAGEKPHSEIPGYMHENDIFVLPSIHEGFGVGLIEAMSCGLPCIASKTGGIIDIIDDGITGYLVEPANDKKIAEKILSLFYNNKLRREMGRNGRKKVEEKFNWEKIADKTMKIYEEVTT